MTKQIEDYIKENLIGEAQATALEFVAFLRSNNIEFYKDNGSCWKDKIYYWLKFKDECVAFIAIKDPDEPENLWTVWSDDSKVFEADIINDEIVRQNGDLYEKNHSRAGAWYFGNRHYLCLLSGQYQKNAVTHPDGGHPVHLS